MRMRTRHARKNAGPVALPTMQSGCRSISQSEAIKRILDTVTDKVLSYRPVDKGLAAKKTKRKLARKAKRDD